MVIFFVGPSVFLLLRVRWVGNRNSENQFYLNIPLLWLGKTEKLARRINLKT